MKMSKLSKKICGVMIAMSFLIVPAQPAEAGFLSALGEGLLDTLILDPETAARKHANQILDALWKSAVLMEESKLCLAEALDMNPRRIASLKESLRQITRDRGDLNAIRVSTYNEIPEDALEYGVSMLLSDEDRAADIEIQSLMKRSQVARHAAHGYNQGAIGHIAQAIFHIERLKEQDPRAADRAMAYLVDKIGDAQSLLEMQRDQSKMFHRVFDVFNKKYNIKEPTKKEVKKIEKELLPK